MDWKVETMMATRSLLAVLLGVVIGWERERSGHEAGVRTYAAVALGACAYGLVSSHVPGNTDPTRIAAGVVTGIGFLGAGVILRGEGNRVTGLTTAATIWATAAVGLAVAYAMYTLATITTLVVAGLLFTRHLPRPNRPAVSRPDAPPAGGPGGRISDPPA
jgi:putative Mg2+ transporter-C (MgtC) family protein